MSPQDEIRIKNRIRELIMQYCNNRERFYKAGSRKTHQMKAITEIRRKLAWYQKLTFKSHLRLVKQCTNDLLVIMPAATEPEKNRKLGQKIRDMITFCQGRMEEQYGQQLNMAS